MTNLDLAIIIALLTQKICNLIVWCAAYVGGDPRPNKRQEAIDTINKISSDIDESCKEIAAMAKGDAQ